MPGQGLIEHETKANWLRLQDVFSSENGYSLWGDSGISPYDIRQGNIGNCWFIAAASAMAERRDRLERLFINENLEENGGISP